MEFSPYRSFFSKGSAFNRFKSDWRTQACCQKKKRGQEGESQERSSAGTSLSLSHESENQPDANRRKQTMRRRKIAAQVRVAGAARTTEAAMMAMIFCFPNSLLAASSKKFSRV